MSEVPIPPQILALNIQGLVPTTGASKAAYKVSALKEFLQDQSGFIPIISLTESWCKTYHSNAQN